MDAHSHDMNMLHKCNRARRQNAANVILLLKDKEERYET